MNNALLILIILEIGVIIQMFILIKDFYMHSIKVNGVIVAKEDNDSDTYAEKFTVEYNFGNCNYTKNMKTFFFTKKKIGDTININTNPKVPHKIKYFGSNNMHFYKGLSINILITLILTISLFYYW